jgi:hypothetical protein
MRVWITAAVATVLVAGCATAPANSLSSGSCPVGSAKAVIILTDKLPSPVVIMPVGVAIVVTVPRWTSGTATDVNVAAGGILREECTVLLPGGGRRTVFQALRPGSTFLGASVKPTSGAFMPAWSGKVIVRGTLTAGLPSIQVSPGTP